MRVTIKLSRPITDIEANFDEMSIMSAGYYIGRWIPVSERSPLYGEDVLAVRRYGENGQEVLIAHIALWNEKTGEKTWNATNITHWMPLPLPPESYEE